MAISSKTTISAQAGGVSCQASLSVNVNSVIPISVTLPAAIAGTLGVYTSGTSIQLTLPSGHGISAGQRLDVYWTDATTGITFCQYGGTVGALVGATGVPVSGGAGNTFPNSLGLAMTCQVPTAVNCIFTPANVKQIAVGSSGIGAAIVTISAGTTVCFSRVLRTVGGDTYQWTYSQGDTNPTSGSPAIAYFSNGATTANTISMYIAGT